VIAEKKRLLANTLGSADFAVCTAWFFIWFDQARMATLWDASGRLLDPRLDQMLAFLPLAALWLFLLPPGAGTSTVPPAFSDSARLLRLAATVVSAGAAWTAALLAVNVPLSAALRTGALACGAGITYFAILRSAVHGLIPVFFQWRQFEERTWVIYPDGIPPEQAWAAARTAGWPLKPVAVTPWSGIADAFIRSEGADQTAPPWVWEHLVAPAVDCLLCVGRLEETARNRIADLCRRMGLTFAECRTAAQDESLRIEEVSSPGWSVLSLLLKEILDVSISLPLLAASLPLMLLVGALVRLTSRGPAFFRQERMGRHGRLFRMLKFRSMYVDAGDAPPQSIEPPDILFKDPDDPRVTPFGRLIRRASLDELPQLWNVVRGEMSLVGPRPMPLYEIKHFRRVDDFRRHALKPGLTGLWQVSGRSNVRSLDERLRLDLTYVDRWSLLLDIKVLVRTLPAVLTGRGAQ